MRPPDGPVRDIAEFVRMRQHCRGMLRERVYEAIYHAIGGLSAPGAIVEVGTSHAAATVAAAWAVQDRGADRTVHTVDKIVGGSPDIYGDPEISRQVILGNLAAFGVADIVRFTPGTVRDLLGSGPLTGPVAAVILDADGCIDRDLAQLAPHLAEGGLCIIDDYADLVRLIPLRGGAYRVDAKMKLTYELVNLFVEMGILEIHRVDGATAFAQLIRPRRLCDPDVRDLAIEAYRRQVLLTAEKTSSLQWMRKRTARKLRGSMPRLYRQYRRLKLNRF